MNKLNYWWIEIRLWAFAMAVAGLIAGGALGAVLSEGAFARGTFSGAAIGLLAGMFGGIVVRSLLELVWRLGELIGSYFDQNA
jgi:hypothetical protein